MPNFLVPLSDQHTIVQNSLHHVHWCCHDKLHHPGRCSGWWGDAIKAAASELGVCKSYRQGYHTGSCPPPFILTEKHRLALIYCIGALLALPRHGGGGHACTGWGGAQVTAVGAFMKPVPVYASPHDADWTGYSTYGKQHSGRHSWQGATSLGCFTAPAAGTRQISVRGPRV